MYFLLSTIEIIQCTGYVGRYHQYVRGCSILRKDIISIAGLLESNVGDFSALEDVINTLEQYHQYCEGCSINQIFNILLQSDGPIIVVNIVYLLSF